MRAVERIDLNAEKFFRADLGGLNPQDSNFWTKIDDYKQLNDLNGFFIRNDVDGNYNSQENNNRIYDFNTQNYIFNYNNQQLKFVDYYKNYNSIGDDKGIIKAESVFNKTTFQGLKGIKTNNRSVMSQDEVWWLYMGLAMVAKLVDSPKIYTDTEGDQVTIREWVAKITHRTQLALTIDDKPIVPFPTTNWRIINPITSEKVLDTNGGNTYYLSSAFVLSALNIISYTNSPNSTQYKKDILNAAPYFTTNIPVFAIALNLAELQYKKESSVGAYNLGLISGLSQFNYYTRLMNETTLYTKSINREYYPLFWSVLKDETIKDIWRNTQLFSISYDNYLDSLKMLLNAIPECGSFSNREKDKKISDSYWFKNRLREVNELRSIGFCDAVPHSLSINSSMDYMILFNLYTLLIADNLDMYGSNENLNYPFTMPVGTGSSITFGTHSSPVYFKGINFYMNNTINSEGDVTLNALKTVKLTNGFQVKAGGTFVAYTSVPNCDFNFTGYNYCSHRESKYSSNLYDDSKKQDNLIDSIKNDILQQDSTIKYTIYPNPVTIELIVEINSNTKVNQIVLYDYSGRIIKRYSETVNILYIDFSVLQNGIYLLLIYTEKGVFKEKIIK